MPKKVLKTMAAIQVVAILASLVILLSHLQLDWGEEKVLAYGETLSSILLVTGLIGFFQARKGKSHLWILLVAAAIGPLYTLISGPLQQIITYHVICLLAYGLIIRNLMKAAQEQTDESREQT